MVSYINLQLHVTLLCYKILLDLYIFFQAEMDTISSLFGLGLPCRPNTSTLDFECPLYTRG